MRIQDIAKWRKTVKIYIPTEGIDDDDIDKIIETGLLAPSSIGLEPTTVLVIENKEIRKEIAKYAFAEMNYSRVVDAQALFILLGIKPEYFKKNDFEFIEKRVKNWKWLKNTEDRENLINLYKNSFRNKSDHELLTWTKEQAYIVLSFMVLQASELKYGSTIMGGFDQDKLDKWLIKNKCIDGSRKTSIITFSIGQYDEKVPMATRPRYRMPKEEFVKIVH